MTIEHIRVLVESLLDLGAVGVCIHALVWVARKKCP